MELGLFRIPAFAVAVTTALFGIFIMFGAFSWCPVPAAGGRAEPTPGGTRDVAVRHRGDGELVSHPDRMRRMRPVVAISAGLLGLSGAFLLLTQVDGSGSFTLFLAVYTAIPIISGFFFLPVTGLVIGVAPPERAGAAAGISQTAQELGGRSGSLSWAASSRRSTGHQWQPSGRTVSPRR